MEMDAPDGSVVRLNPEVVGGDKEHRSIQTPPWKWTLLMGASFV